MDDDDFYDSSDGESYVDDVTNHDELHQLVTIANKKRDVDLTEQEIRQRLSQEAAATAEVFSVPVDWALALLVHYRWNSPRLHEEWFSDQNRIRDAVGLVVPTREDEEEEEETIMMTCGICTEGKPTAEMASAGCAHRYCHDCWRGYVAAAVEDDGGGPRCLALRCPDASCSRAVLRGMVQRFTEDDEDVYERLLARDYVEARGLWMKPCAAPGCGCVIEIPLLLDGGSDVDLLCRCGNGFCWRCGGAPHWPSSCTAVAQWALEADEASADWIVLHTKPCPQCRRPIERVTGGCHSMRCAAPCFHMFCWRCVGPMTMTTTMEEQLRAKQALYGFLHYQDLWMANLSSRRNAEREVRRLRDEKLPRARGAAEKEHVEAVAAAWEQVAEGRRVLGNACAHGLRLRGVSTRRWELFEYQHGEADAVLERLQQGAQEAAAEDLNKFLGEYGACKLAALTRVTQRCVENFAKAVEEGMPEVMSAPASTTKSAPENKVISDMDLIDKGTSWPVRHN